MPNTAPRYAFDSLQPELRQLRQKVHECCRNFNRSPSKGNQKKLKELFASYGSDVFIEPGFHCDYASKVSLGNRVYFNINCTILDGGLVTLGDDCLIGPNVQLITINHDLNPTKRLDKTNYASDINIGNNVWIGAGAIVLPGVTVGDGAVIAAGSIANRDIPDNTLYAGNPAKMIKRLG